jgi:hypothetical protein
MTPVNILHLSVVKLLIVFGICIVVTVVLVVREVIKEKKNKEVK